MIIISDNIITTNNFFGSSVEPLSSNVQFGDVVEIIKSRIFKNNSVKFYESKKKHDWNYIFLTEYSTESQFDILNKLLSQNIEVPNMLICLAEEGDGFHGFRNRSWKSEKGNIHLSFYYKPNNANKNFHTGLLIVAAVAILKTIDSIPSLDGKAKTKWVNDIVIDNSKVCGIITQSFSSGSIINGAVVGLGLNVLTNPRIDGDIFTPETSSLLSHSNSRDCNLLSVISNLLKNLSDGISMLNQENYQSLLEIYVKRSAIIGKEVSIYSDPINGELKKTLSGKVIDINENLELILENTPFPIKSGRLAIHY